MSAQRKDKAALLPFRVAPHSAGEEERIEGVLNAAFGPGRFAKTSERIRERGAAFVPALSHVAYQGADLKGCCQIWRVRVGEGTALFLGPLAVHPNTQGGGLGALLVNTTVAACAEAANASDSQANDGSWVFLIGAPRFFEPLGFTQVPKGQLTLPGAVDPARLMWIGLKPGALDYAGGTVTGFPAATRT
jgi:predicted N-acetyltransferase YhbS